MQHISNRDHLARVTKFIYREARRRRGKKDKKVT